MDGLGAYPILDEHIIPYLNQFVKNKIEPDPKKFRQATLARLAISIQPWQKSAVLVNCISLDWTIHDYRIISTIMLISL